MLLMFKCLSKNQATFSRTVRCQNLLFLQLDSHHPLCCLLHCHPGTHGSPARSSTCTSLSSTRRGSNTALCAIPAQGCENGTGPPTCPQGFISAFPKTGPHTPRWSLARVCSLSVTTHRVCCTDGQSAAFRASSITWRTSFLCILFPKSSVKTTIIFSAWVSSVNLRLQGHTEHLKRHKVPSGHLPTTSDKQHVRVS